MEKYNKYTFCPCTRFTHIYNSNMDPNQDRIHSCITNDRNDSNKDNKEGGNDEVFDMGFNGNETGNYNKNKHVLWDNTFDQKK